MFKIVETGHAPSLQHDKILQVNLYVQNCKDWAATIGWAVKLSLQLKCAAHL